MANNIKTRAGLEPGHDNALPFTITTNQAEKFLQNKVDRIVQTMNQNGINQEEVKVMLLTTAVSKKFAPFMIVLPTSILKNGDNRKNGNELSIFNPEDTDRAAKLKDPFYQLLSGYAYNKSDENAFFNGHTRGELGITLKAAHQIKANRTPKIQKLNKGRSTQVMMLIDPIRLFHDMLTDVQNTKEKFFITKVSATKIEGANYKYSLTRTKKNGKNKENDSFEQTIAFEVARRMRGDE